MSAQLTTHTLELVIAASSPAPQTLSSLVAHQFVGGIVPSRLSLRISVAPATSVTIVDDLGDDTTTLAPAIIDHTIELVLNRDSSLDYRVRATAPTATAPITKAITVRLVGTGAQANVRYDCYGTEGKTFSIKTLQDHQAPHTTSSVTIKGVFDDRASLNTLSTIRIHKNAQRSHATQTNKNILLNSGARVITTPQLEIEANDVVCKHGAAVSQLNPDDLFYLQSRGLSSAAVRNLLVNAFLF